MDHFGRAGGRSVLRVLRSHRRRSDDARNGPGDRREIPDQAAFERRPGLEGPGQRDPRARDALSAADRFAGEQGYLVTDLGDHLQAEARYLGASHAALARRLAADGQKRAIISGGETTVSVVNPKGRGGRNLEYLLGLAIGLAGAPGISALACDTDGIDGTENAAGAIVLPDTLERARALGLDPAEHLARNNAYLFFERLGDLVVTGPTFTNVNDFRLILIDGQGN
jgi:glycerate 2-kinase